MSIKKYLRFAAFIFFVVLAAMIPIPLKFHSKDNLPKDLIELVERKEEDDEDDDIKEIL